MSSFYTKMSKKYFLTNMYLICRGYYSTGELVTSQFKNNKKITWLKNCT